ncbi:FecR family protein [Sphingomonas sp. DT-204]|uniref:FecR family protein n=1 Tax=Sphingomonas sp. DT-204 TaxID=3396166 RepID=UPI003F1D4B6A
MDGESERFSAQRRDADLEHAAEWFARWQTGSVDEAAFARWRDADPAHALAFARVTAAWESAAVPGALPETAEAPLMPTRRRLMQGGMAAAAVMLAAGSGLVATRAYAWNSASTDVGETRKLRLPDGSMAALNTDSKLFWRFSHDRRDLWLDRGEVALDLQPGPAARLQTGSSAAALGEGRFNARLRRTMLDLIVLRGNARSWDRTMDAPEAAGAHSRQRLLFTEKGPVVQPVPIDGVDAVLAWQAGEIVFLDTPLAQAAAEYNRYLSRKIVIENPSVGAIRVGGRFQSADPTDFLHAVSASLGVRVRTAADGYHLDR